MTKNVALLVFVLLIGAEHFAHAQTGWSNPFAPPPAEPRPAQTFKTGDYVDVQLYGQWIPEGPAHSLAGVAGEPGVAAEDVENH
jgi:hypothetical protein